MHDFVRAHRHLFFKTARLFATRTGSPVPPEDIARELELIVIQRAEEQGLTEGQVASPALFLRKLVASAANRAKRRRKLIEQIAAGDDLFAVSEDLRVLDGDLAPIRAGLEGDEEQAIASFGRFKETLDARDALVFALVYEDGHDYSELASILGLAEPEVLSSRQAILDQATSLRSSLASDPTEDDILRIGQLATGPSPEASHLEDPALSLVRSGDTGEDLDEFVRHLAQCVDCRAKLTELHAAPRSFVVMAIEDPRTSKHDLRKLVEAAEGRFVERGEGRYAAVVEASRADVLATELYAESAEGPRRVVAADPFEVSTASYLVAGARDSSPDVSAGTDAAEVSAWAKMGRRPNESSSRVSLPWALLSVCVIGSAMAVAYLLATR